MAAPGCWPRLQLVRATSPPFDAATGSGPKPPQDFYSPWGDPSKDKRKGLWIVLFAVVFLGHGLLLVGAKEIPEKKKQVRVEMALVKPPSLRSERTSPFKPSLNFAPY